MLTASITLHRKAKDGTDGVGITSADVVFAQSKSNTNPPADSDNWKTKVELLNLVDGYLWSGTKIVYSNKKTAITGKYCIGSTRDYTDIEELYYLSDSGDKIPTGVTFQSSFKPEKGKYLWTCIRYRFKAASGAAENSNWVYSTPTCAGYFGDDGVSVKSSDVVFGIGTKTQQPSSWITNFSDLVLEQGKYVWTCTKTILTSSSTPIYTGAYCLGECYDFAQVEELYALSDSSTNPPGMGNFTSSYKVVKGKYLWSCVKVTYSGGSIDYLNIRCVNYFPTDGTNGTKFTPRGTAYAHYSKASELPTPSAVTVNRKYLVDVDDKSTPAKNTPCVCYYKNTTTFMSDVAAEGDAYNIGGTLWVHDGKVWHDFGSVQGPKGEDGQDALNIELSVEKILFSYNKNDKNDFDPKSKIVSLIVRQGGSVIKSSEYNVKILAAQNFDISTGEKLTITKQDNYCTLSCYASGVTIYSYSYDNDAPPVSYPASSCSIKIAVEYNGITYFKEISIEVSFVKMYGGLNWDIEHLSSTYGKLTNGFDGTLVQMETRVNQNAEKITAEATKTIGDKLEKSGIYIESGKILAKTNHFEVQNSNGDTTFTIDKDGNLVSEGNARFKGCITATSGNIGGLEIYNDTYQFGGQTFNYKGLIYQNMEYDGYLPNHSINLNDRYLYVGYGDSGFGGVFIAGYSQSQTSTVGGQTEFSVGAFLTVESHTDNSATMQPSTAGRFTASGNKDGISRALEVSAYGGKENYAVDALNGDIRLQNGDFRAENGAFIGVHRDNVTKIYNDYTLKKTDSTIICINKNKAITINLPSDAEPGTFYRIIKRGESVTFKSNTMNISFVSYGDVVSSVSSGKKREWINCFWDGDYWYVEMSGN